MISYRRLSLMLCSVLSLVLLSASRAPAQDDLHHGLVQAPGGIGPFTAQVNWSPPFADANYAAVCTIEADLGFVEGRVEIQAGSRTPSSMIVGVSGVAGNTGTVHCIGVANSSTISHGSAQVPGGFGPFTTQLHWSTPFPDTSYVATCSIEAELGFVEGRIEIQAGSRTPSGMIVGVSELEGASGVVSCIGVANSSTISHGSAQVPGGFGPFTTQLHWSTPFPDTSYVATCSIEAELGFVEGRIEIQAGSRTPSGMIVGVSELEGASGVVSCIGVPGSSSIAHASAQVPGGFGPFTTQLQWSTPFPDTSYVATCSIEAELGFVEGRIEIQAGSRTPSGMIVGVSQLEGASGVVSCIGVGVGPVTFACPQGQGFWKNHPDTWRVTSLTMGSQAYTQAELLALFDTPPSDDASVILAHRLIAAKLNIANGSNPAPI